MTILLLEREKAEELRIAIEKPARVVMYGDDFDIANPVFIAMIVV